MKRENDEIADLFRSRLDHCELSVRDGFWEELEKNFPVRETHRPRAIYFRYAAVAAVFLALIGMSATLWLFAPKEEIEEVFTQVAATSGQIKLPSSDFPQEMFAVTPRPLLPQHVLPTIPTVSEYVDDSVSMSFSFSLSSECEPEIPDNVPDDVILAGNGSLEQSHAKQQNTIYSPEKKKGWAVGVHALTATSAMGKKAKMPISAGMSVRKQLTDRFALETGVNYTLLRSDVTSENNSNTLLRQKAHYIGIPIKAAYTLVDKKKVDLYLTGGALLEKCIGMTGDVSIEQPRKMQYALTASVGVQYKIGKNVAVFAEPGIAYNVDNGASTPEIRKEKPLNFNLLCGVRVVY